MRDPDWSMVEAAFMNKARQMNEPNWQRVADSFSYAADRIANAGEAAMAEWGTRGLWAVAYNLVPFLDGDKYCVLLGDNLQDGIAGFGKTPADAIWDFQKAMTEGVGRKP